jgi:hypothetical protein
MIFYPLPDNNAKGDQSLLFMKERRLASPFYQSQLDDPHVQPSVIDS